MSLRIATGVAQRERRVLLVASRYASHDEPLWTLPGGRQEAGELARETVLRELLEETGLRGETLGLAYASESYDGTLHVANLTFSLLVEGDPRPPSHHDHVVDAEWVSIDDLETRITIAVVREPLIAYLRGDARTYFGYHEAGVSIQWLE